MKFYEAKTYQILDLSSGIWIYNDQQWLEFLSLMLDWALNVSTLVFLRNAPTGHNRVCFFHPCFGWGIKVPPPGWGTQRAFAAIRSDGGIVTWGQGEFGGDLSSAVREQFLYLWTPPKSSSSNQNRTVMYRNFIGYGFFEPTSPQPTPVRNKGLVKLSLRGGVGWLAINWEIVLPDMYGDYSKQL